MSSLPKPSSQSPRRRRLYHDVLREPDRTGRFFSWPHPTPAAFAGCARHLDGQTYDREALTGTLLRQNQLLDAPAEAIEAARMLARPDALCAFTGQQAGLFGGPLFTIYKALTLLGWAEKLRTMLNRPVVPIFWIASDDHDFEEVRWTGFPSRDNNAERLMLPAEGIAERMPISRILLPDQMREFVTHWRDAQLETEFTDAVFRALADDYAPGRSMPDAFGRWMSRLLGPYGLVVFNPSCPEAKALMQPLFRQELEGFEQTAAALNEINQRLDEAGYEQQVAHPDRNTHLFHVNGGRHAIRITDDGLLMTDREGIPMPRARWVERLSEDPAAFSPGVLFRPVAQSNVFPVLSVICGPSEIAYWAQARALFERFGTPMPVVLPRSCATVIENKIRRGVEALGHDVSEFFGDIEALINTHFERSFPVGLEKQFDEQRRKLENQLTALKASVIEFEPTLGKTFDVTTGRIVSAWETLHKKVFQAHKRKGDEIRNRFYKLAAHLYPEGQPQERIFSAAYFINKYGFQFIERVREQLRIGTTDHQTIEP